MDDRYVIVAGGVVVNTIRASVEFADTIGAIRSDTAEKGDVHLGGTEFEPPPVDLEAERARLIAAIDADADQLVRRVVGDRLYEYTRAETQAAEFAAEGYLGEVPPSVASWAVAKGWTARQAADDILLQAQAWNDAQDALRAQRLLRKEQARAASTAGALRAIEVAWTTFLGQMAVALGVA